MTDKQQEAHKRNWTKFKISGLYAQARNMPRSDFSSLTEIEKGYLLEAADILKLVLDNWEKKEANDATDTRSMDMV